MKGKAKPSLAFPSEPRRKQKMIQNQAAGLHKNNNSLFHLLQCCQISICNLCLWDISCGTITHINVFLSYLLVQELFFNKNHFLDFLSVGCNVALLQLNIFAANRSTKKIQAVLAQKIRAVLVLFFLLGICILVCSCTECGTSKFYLYLEDNRSSFSRLS